jgi:hypothetical protein
MSFRMDCQPMSWLRSTMQPSRPSQNGHPISTAFRFRSGAKEPERDTLRNAVIDWPDGDEGEKSHFRDGVKIGKAPCKHMFSALPLRADIAQRSRHVRKVPHNRTHASQQQKAAYSITSSARASRDGETFAPIAFAVRRLIASQKLVGNSMGSSPGLAPLRIFTAKYAPRR